MEYIITSSGRTTKYKFIFTQLIIFLQIWLSAESQSPLCSYGAFNNSLAPAVTCRVPPVKDCGSSSISGSWLSELDENELTGRLDTFVVNLAWVSPMLDDIESTRISEIRCDRDEYMPLDCRIVRDLCNGTNTTDEVRGNISWPITDLGTRRYMLCPYAYPWEELYASYDCLIDYQANNTPAWFNNVTDGCPPPQLHREIEAMYNNLTTNETALSDDASCNDLLTDMNSLMKTRGNRPTEPVFEIDHKRLVNTCFIWARDCLMHNLGLNGQQRILWNISDMLFDMSQFRQYWIQTDFRKFVRYLSLLYPDELDSFEFRGHDIYAYSHKSFSAHSLSSDLVQTQNTFATVEFSGNATSEQVQFLFIREYLTSSVIVAGPIPPGLPDQPGPPGPPGSRPRIPGIPGAPTFGFAPPVGLPGGLRAGGDNRGNPNGGPASDGPQRRRRHVHSEAVGPDGRSSAQGFQGGLNFDLVSTTMGMSGTGNSNWNPVLTTVGGSTAGWIIGPLVYIDLSNARNEEGNNVSFTNTQRVFHVTLQHPFFSKLLDVSSKLAALRTTSREILGNVWFAADCRMLVHAGSTVEFQCTQPGYYAVGYINPTGPPGAPGAVGETTTTLRMLTTTSVPSLSVFLGFEYNYQLYLAGLVLRAVSLVCHVITVLSYLIFKKARRGIPTEILLHLCITLILLNVVLYVAEAKASTRLGCRVCNVFRYYLVLVSLLWNGIEAYNMYRMLIKVFSTGNTSYFVTKSALLAWGLPAVGVGIAFAVNVYSFDGTYYQCIFRCSLRDYMLYYGWLIPMGVIMIHNLVIFVLVMNVLCRRKTIQSSNTSSTSAWTRLCGAMTMLVLLGVPWMFSAFGVINAGDNKSLSTLEGVFNGVFTVCISVQGMFIFWFHCARVASVREQWKNGLFSASGISSFFQSSSSVLSKRRKSSSKDSKEIVNMGSKEAIMEATKDYNKKESKTQNNSKEDVIEESIDVNLDGGNWTLRSNKQFME